MGKINCCNGCVPPKRNPYCHGSCPEYAEEKAENDRQKAIEYEKKQISRGLYEQRQNAVEKAWKGQRKK